MQMKILHILDTIRLSMNRKISRNEIMRACNQLFVNATGVCVTKNNFFDNIGTADCCVLHLKSILTTSSCTKLLRHLLI